MICLQSISNMSIGEIRDSVRIIESNLNDYLKYESLDGIIECLNNDRRKGVNNLSYKLLMAKEKYYNEIKRVKALYDFDKYFTEKYVAGIDEVGRGPLAGPIVAAAVIMDLDYKKDEDLILYINDSKKLNENKRKELSKIIKEKAFAYNIAELDNEVIDYKGIGYCNNQIFIDSVEGLSIRPGLVLSDGYPIKNYDLVKNIPVIKGDNKSVSIACASIIAKVYRDNLMKKLALEFPKYGFEKHVGYGTKEHISAIVKYGPCKIHRKSFLNNIL